MNSLVSAPQAFKKRLQKLQSTLSPDETVLIEEPCDVYYLSGKAHTKGSLYVMKNEAFFIIDSRCYGACLDLTFIKPVLFQKGKEKEILQKAVIKHLYFDPFQTTYERFTELDALLKGLVTLSPQASPVRKMRRVKDPQEITIMKNNAKLLYKCYEELFSVIEEGISEKELARFFKIAAYKHGADGFSFEPIIAFGENSAYPHHQSCSRKLKKGDIILIDIGIEKDHYQSDMTRMVFFGQDGKELMKWHDLVLEAHDAALKLCKPGMLIKDLDIAARAIFKEAGVEKYFLHTLGHGIGLRVHEGFRLRQEGEDANLVLQEGMVFTVEPGLYLEGKGGIRYEDTLVITAKGYENFFPEKMTRQL